MRTISDLASDSASKPCIGQPFAVCPPRGRSSDQADQGHGPNPRRNAQSELPGGAADASFGRRWLGPSRAEEVASPNMTLDQGFAFAVILGTIGLLDLGSAPLRPGRPAGAAGVGRLRHRPGRRRPSAASATNRHHRRLRPGGQRRDRPLGPRRDADEAARAADDDQRHAGRGAGVAPSRRFRPSSRTSARWRSSCRSRSRSRAGPRSPPRAC